MTSLRTIYTHFPSTLPKKHIYACNNSTPRALTPIIKGLLTSTRVQIPNQKEHSFHFTQPCSIFLTIEPWCIKKQNSFAHLCTQIPSQPWTSSQTLKGMEGLHLCNTNGNEPIWMKRIREKRVICGPSRSTLSTKRD